MNIFKTFKNRHEMMVEEDQKVLEQHREARKHQTDEFQTINREKIQTLAHDTGVLAVAKAHQAHEEALQETGSFPVVRTRRAA